MRNRRIDDRLRFLHDALQVIGAAEALGVDLVDLFGARWPRGKPAAFRDHLDAADRRAIAWGGAEDTCDLFAGEFGRFDALRSECRELPLLLRRRRRLDPIVDRVAELARKLGIQRARVAPVTRGDLGGEQRRYDAILVGGPDRTV